MKYNIKTLSPNQYLDIVNREENPDGNNLEIEYVKIGTAYFAYCNTAFGKIVSAQYQKGRDLTDDEAETLFDQVTEDIKKEFETIRSKQVMPNFLSFGGTIS